MINPVGKLAVLLLLHLNTQKSKYKNMLVVSVINRDNYG